MTLYISDERLAEFNARQGTCITETDTRAADVLRHKLGGAPDEDTLLHLSTIGKHNLDHYADEAGIANHQLSLGTLGSCFSVVAAGAAYLFNGPALGIAASSVLFAAVAVNGYRQGAKVQQDVNDKLAARAPESQLRI